MMQNAEKAAQRWAEAMARKAAVGILCRGCGYRVPPDQWRCHVWTGKFYCPHCRTALGSL